MGGLFLGGFDCVAADVAHAFSSFIACTYPSPSPSSACVAERSAFQSNTSLLACSALIPSLVGTDPRNVVMPLDAGKLADRAECTSMMFNATYTALVQACGGEVNPLAAYLGTANASLAGSAAALTCHSVCAQLATNYTDIIGSCVSSAGAVLLAGLTDGCKQTTGGVCAANLAGVLTGFGEDPCNAFSTSGTCSASASCTWFTSRSACVGHLSYTSPACSDECLLDVLRGNASSALPGDVVAGLVSACAPPCLVVCPDGTCALSLPACSCIANSIIQASILTPSTQSMDVRQVLKLQSAAQYFVTNGTCANADLSLYLRYQWSLSLANGTAVRIGPSIATNQPSITFPSLFFSGATAYNVTLTLYGLLPSQMATVVYKFATSSVVPLVNIAMLGTLRTVAPTNIFIAAQVQDVNLDPSLAAWSCQVSGGGSCPSSVAAALPNGTVKGLTIAGPVPAGTYMITLTYRGVSSNLTLVVASTSVPVVQIVSGTAAFIAPNIFLSPQLVFAAVVTFSSPTSYSYEWRVNNGTVVGTEARLVLNTTGLNTSSSADAKVANVISVMVTTTVAPMASGLSEFVAYVVAPPTLTLSVAENYDHPTEAFAVMGQDRLLLKVTSSAFSAAPFGALYTLGFGYYSTPLFATAPVFMKLSASPGAMAGSFIATVPFFHVATGSSLLATFGVRLHLNDVEVAEAQATFNVTLPSDRSAALTGQINAASSVSNPSSAIDVASQIGTLMAMSTNRTERAEAAKTVVSVLFSQIANASTPASLDSGQQAQVFSSLTAAVVSAVTDVEREVLSVMSATIGSSVSSSVGQTALGLLSTLNQTNQTASVATTLANAVLNGSTLGTPTTLSSPNGMSIIVLQQTGSAVQNSTVGNSNSSLAVPSAFTFPGFSATAIVGFSSVQYPANPLGANGTSGALASLVVSYDLSVDGSPTSVSGLSTALTVTFVSTDPANAQCMYFDLTSGEWSSAGLVKAGFTSDGVVSCQTTHLTSFAGFSSFGSSTTATATTPALTAYFVIMGVVVVAIVVCVVVAVMWKRRQLKRVKSISGVAPDPWQGNAVQEDDHGRRV